MAGNNLPLVSILMTAYNREAFIAEAIESVLASTYTNFELIIVDDCSRDKTIEIARAYATKDNRVKVYLNNENLGDYNNRNKAASYAQGVYLKYLDSDDLIMPWGLEVMIYCIELFPSAALGVCANRSENRTFPALFEPKAAYREYYYRNNLLGIGPTGSIIRKSVFDSIGGFSGENYIGDTQLWLKLATKHSVVYMPPGLVFWREHDGQQIVEEKKNALIELKRFRLDIDILTNIDCPLKGEEKANILRNLKNNKVRKIFKSIVMGRVVAGFRKFRQFDIGVTDILKAMLKNKIIKTEI